jgi:1-acyl-sn-glycerol-3-phosphate acyltransferase
MMPWLRSVLYFTGLLPLTALFCALALLVLPLPPMLRYRIVTCWTRLALYWLRLTCGVRWVVEGLEHVPDTPVVVACKHQSAWETMALQLIFPPQVWVLKRELLWLPLFGWGLATLSPIAINRSNRAEASRQLLVQGRDRIAKGFWIVVFPEGTRIPAGRRGKYKMGGARLAHDLHVPLLPVAHNAGLLWPRNSFVKQPGTITVRIGPPLAPDSADAAGLMLAAETWIESAMLDLTPASLQPVTPYERPLR